MAMTLWFTFVSYLIIGVIYANLATSRVIQIEQEENFHSEKSRNAWLAGVFTGLVLFWPVSLLRSLARWL